MTRFPRPHRRSAASAGDAARAGRPLIWIAVVGLALAGCRSTTDSLGKNHPDTPFEEVLDVESAEVNDKLEAAYQQLFHSADEEDESIRRTNPDGAYVVDVLTGDIKTDGLGYGLFLAVMLDEQEDFDALWAYAKKNLQYTDGARSGLLYWVCSDDGECPDPNGMSYVATSLFFASNRWGQGEHDYAADSLELRDAMLHRQDDGVVDDVYSCFDAEAMVVKNSPIGDIRFTTPAFMLPAFYEIWAEDGPAEDAEMLRDLAAAARDALVRVADPVTGLTWEQVYLDLTLGSPPGDFTDHFWVDAYRVGFNLALDIAWFGGNDDTQEVVDDLVVFFSEYAEEVPFDEYKRNGEELSETRSIALAAANAAAASGATPSAGRDTLIRAVWELPVPTGQNRYYDGLLYLLALGALSGTFVPY
ncbi:MAG: hypothetical protein JW751_09530 [Polyangiaceae bacterium]|nr:hypothetical protein [Polyangiaceae bacterium]